MIAQLRNVRFISADSASQASRSSPSMSSSNSSASESSPRAMRSATSPSAPDRQRIFVGDEAERPQPRALQPARQQHAERLVREPAFERIADEIVLRRRAERSRPAARRGRGSSERHCWMSSHSRTCVGSAPQCCRIGERSGARARRDRSRAETCRPRRTGPSGRSRCARET